MRLDRLPADHKRMMKHWIAWTTAHRDALLRGSFSPRRPELGFPLLEGASAAERVIAVYDPDFVAAVPADEEGTLRRYIRYLVDKKRFVAALDLALTHGLYDLIDGIVDGTLLSGDKIYSLVEYCRIRGDRDFEEIFDDSLQKKYLLAVIRFHKRDYKKMLSLAEEIVADGEKHSPLERTGHYLKFLALTASGQYRQQLPFDSPMEGRF